ncbi:HAD family phosphatase [Vibrio sp. ZSDE26]|uniref:HAD family phosphatase n=1 Tax=Vibrio amylolyticus TaxID=2847292 RepID=A0A9X1XNM8_9VIBR|nr:HAD family phosphatase [Vibrio amylolyticus]MCK6265785.1 HAD family phosphatase [Vibrio amylolyticus]
MSQSNIKNVVFDVGNVIVRWSPAEIVRLTFGDIEQPEKLATRLFQDKVWLDLNKGLMTEEEAKAQYHQQHQLSVEECERLFYYVKQSLILLYGSVDLIKRLKGAGYRIFALTDNVVEIVEYLKSTYDFWVLFEGATVSADLGLLKPQPEIYQALLSQHDIRASETVFIDDMPHNVKGAEDAEISAIQFENAAQCEAELRALGLSF